MILRFPVVSPEPAICKLGSLSECREGREYLVSTFMTHSDQPTWYTILGGDYGGEEGGHEEERKRREKRGEKENENGHCML